MCGECEYSILVRQLHPAYWQILSREIPSLPLQELELENPFALTLKTWFIVMRMSNETKWNDQVEQDGARS